MGDVHGGAIDPLIATRVQEYLDEATNGPEKGGIAGDLVIGAVTLEATASRGWGVEFSRTLTNGARVSERLTAKDLTVHHAGAAIGKLLRAA